MGMPRMAATRRNTMTTKQKKTIKILNVGGIKIRYQKKLYKRISLRIWITLLYLHCIRFMKTSVISRAQQAEIIRAGGQKDALPRKKERKRIPMSFNIFNKINFRKTVFHFAMLLLVPVLVPEPHKTIDSIDHLLLCATWTLFFFICLLRGASKRRRLFSHSNTHSSSFSVFWCADSIVFDQSIKKYLQFFHFFSRVSTSWNESRNENL